MATTQATVLSERWLDQVIIICTLPADTAGAPMNENIRLPIGLSDVAIMSLHARASAVDVGPAAAYTVDAGLRAFVVSSDAATVVDPIGVAPWLLTFSQPTNLEYSAFIDPMALVLWRQNELVQVTAPELDSDATPTGDFNVFIKAVRVRPIEGVARGPMRLVDVTDM